MKLFHLIQLFASICAVQSLDVVFYLGLPDQDCAGETTTLDSIQPDNCYGSSNILWSCISVHYEGSDVATSIVYSSQSGNKCAIVLEGDLGDNQYFQAEQAISGYTWTENPGDDYLKRSIEKTMENRDESSSNGNFKHLGFTVNGRTYNIPKESLSEIPAGSNDEQEAWLKSNNYTVVHDLANSQLKTRITEKKD